MQIFSAELNIRGAGRGIFPGIVLKKLQHVSLYQIQISRSKWANKSDRLW
jgi:hypothetical protein